MSTIYNFIMTKRKIAFFGSDEIAIPCLNDLMQLSSDCEICGVLTQPDRRSGRGRKLLPNPIKKWALESNIPVKDPEKPGAEIVEWIEGLGTDLVLIMAYGHILKEALLKIAPCGCFNLHASLLPKYRGASPIESAIASGERKTGVTLMGVIPRMDAGPIIDAESVQIARGDTGADVRGKISQACIPLLNRNMDALLSGNARLSDQDEQAATYCRKLLKSDGRLNFHLSARDLIYRNRAFADWPGSYFFHEDKMLRVGKMAELQESVHLLPGQRLAENDNSLIIGTANGTIEILELQKPGGTMLPVGDFLRGYSLPREIIFLSPADQLDLIR